MLNQTRQGTVTPTQVLDASATSVRSFSAPTLHTLRAILTDLFGPPAHRSFAVRLPDGSLETPGSERPVVFTLVLRRPGALRSMFWPPSDLALGEACVRGDFDIEGNIEAAIGLLDTLTERLRSPLRVARVAARLRTLPASDQPGAATHTGLTTPHLRGARHSRQRDAAAVRFHYDVGNDFYALWLDQRMVYSCAYFTTGAEDLDAAQTAKLEHICRKLRLKPGERLLDIGCGWGGLVQYAAERYGVQALGITLSEPQAVLARHRLATAGLANQARIEVRDYRDLPRGQTFDKVVSVGMFEHVGAAKLPTYFAEAYRLTRPGGLFLNHGIVTTGLPSTVGPLGWALSRLPGQESFIQRYVFPDSELVTPGTSLRIAESAGFETRDLESLREHYALTLRHWVRRLEARHSAAMSCVNEATYRVWRLYMAGAAHMFARGSIGVVQALFSKPDATGATALPLTRQDIYNVEN